MEGGEAGGPSGDQSASHSAAAALAAELRGPERALFILELAAVLGGLCFVEQRLFETLGGLAASGCEPAVAHFASGASLAASWRAGELEALLPVSVGLPDPSELVALPGPAAGAGLTELASLAAAPSVAEEALSAESVGLSRGRSAAVMVLSRWYPALGWAYAARRALAAEAADAPFGQAFERLEADVAAAGRRGSRLCVGPWSPGWCS
ncbi:MAG: hypothetical protein ACRDZ6_04385 [Acidimicrobiales bacterium]